MDRLLAYGFGAERSFAAAVAADEGFALAHAGGALFAFVQGDGAAREGADRPGARPGGRRDAARAAARRGAVRAHRRREARAASASSTEHLKEFPRDALLVNQAEQHASASAGARTARSFAAASSSVWRPAYGDDWWYQSALGVHVSRGGALRGVPRACPSARSPSIRATPTRATTSPTSASRPPTTTAASAFLGLARRLRPPRAVPLPPRLAPRAVRAAARPTGARARDLRARHRRRRSNPRLAMMDGAALCGASASTTCHEGPLPWRPLADLAAKVSRPGLRLRRRSTRPWRTRRAGDDGALAKR